ncbi:hypothetical protein SAMN04488066_11428 [Halorubrum aquaticum]|uniref:Uncharacterized protein n=1 Tax=Halorubrum aquaticum TaxID=387340 RepID=A0A1I3BPX1_9EURY|nr:hypothetical protein [Halorubrum aquaticum]SFH63969.1 hypothetical protein SAMN04488066_11428 [Halorubrum aquaticum]
MSREIGEDGDGPLDERRRRFLGYAGLAAVGAGGVAGAWTLTRPDEPAGSDPAPSEPSGGDGERSDEERNDEEQAGGDDGESIEEVPAVVERYAPDLYFGALEKWFPTDPRAYVVDSPDGPVVDGFRALEEYSREFHETGSPPTPTAFYRVVEAADGVDAVQYWFYSVFDQFTVNFHWHDWELLQVFLDRETGDPLLLSASAHARGTPNNEFLDPDLSEGRRPGILSEVGSHSSASELNGVRPSFERLPGENWRSDVTNDLLGVAGDLAAPFAYGLPRGEGARLPFVMPELDGYPLHDHPSLSVERVDFIDERVTVNGWRGLPTPPEGIPLRQPGLVMTHPDSATRADATYALEPMASLPEAIADFVGPQLSFEFAIPGFAEDRFADHITSVGIPWEQPRYADPLADVTDPAHRRRIDGESPSGLSNRVVGRVRSLAAGSDGALDGVDDDARDALGDAVAVSRYALPVEVAVRLASEDPTATVTREGVFGYLDVEPGEHLLVVDGPGFAPVAQRFVHDGGTFHAGADGELTVIPAEDAGWIRGDGRESRGIARVRVVEDYAGVVYDGAPTEADRFAVAVHREGRYTVEVVDAEGRPGAYRVTPGSFGEGTETVLDSIETGKASLSRALRDELADLIDLARSLREGTDETADADRETDADGDVVTEDDGDAVIDRLSRARSEAETAVRLADRGDATGANERLATVVSLLREAIELLTGERRTDYDAAAVSALEPRIDVAIGRAATAIETAI